MWTFFQFIVRENIVLLRDTFYFCWTAVGLCLFNSMIVCWMCPIKAITLESAENLLKEKLQYWWQFLWTFAIVLWYRSVTFFSTFHMFFIFLSIYFLLFSNGKTFLVVVLCVCLQWRTAWIMQVQIRLYSHLRWHSWKDCSSSGSGRRSRGRPSCKPIPAASLMCLQIPSTTQSQLAIRALVQEV